MNLYRVIKKKVDDGYVRSKELITSDAYVNTDIVFTTQIMDIPTISFEIPYEVLVDKGIKDSTFEFILEFPNSHIFHGKVTRKETSFLSGITIIQASHIAEELTHQRVPTNYALKGKTFNEMYNPNKDNFKEMNGKFNADGWTFKVEDKLKNYKFTYLFSNQNKLDALSDACKQTEDIFWRVSLQEERTIEIGRFGEYKDFVINRKNALGTDVTVVEDYENITNYGIYFTDKSDSGTTALTLRDVYKNPKLQDKNFPVIETGKEINTERNYEYIDLIPFGANNHGDYAVLDKVGVALEAGNIYEEAFTSNDVQSVADSNKELTDADRLQASLQLYRQSIRKLIHSRRRLSFVLGVVDIPFEINVGDKIKTQLLSQYLDVTECSNFQKKLLSINDKFYITEFTQTVSIGGGITYEVIVEPFLYHNAEV